MWRGELGVSEFAVQTSSINTALSALFAFWTHFSTTLLANLCWDRWRTLPRTPDTENSKIRIRVCRYFRRGASKTKQIAHDKKLKSNKTNDYRVVKKHSLQPRPYSKEDNLDNFVDKQYKSFSYFYKCLVWNFWKWIWIPWKSYRNGIFFQIDKTTFICRQWTN